MLGSIKPDIILLDLGMPEMDGIEATRLITTKSVPVPVVVLSMYPEYQESALAAGAKAFITKGDPLEHLLEALTQASSTI